MVFFKLSKRFSRNSLTFDRKWRSEVFNFRKNLRENFWQLLGFSRLLENLSKTEKDGNLLASPSLVFGLVFG